MKRAIETLFVGKDACSRDSNDNSSLLLYLGHMTRDQSGAEKDNRLLFREKVLTMSCWAMSASVLGGPRQFVGARAYLNQ